MMLYPFLAAALPELKAGVYPDFTVAEFDEQAAAVMTPCDFRRLCLSPEAEQAPEVYRRYRLFNEFFAWRIAQVRSGRLNISIDLEVPEEFFQTVEALMSKLTAETDPAVREHQIDQLLWQYLDDLESGHDLDFEYCCIYRLRLQILQKYAGRNRAAGERKFSEIVEKKSGIFANIRNCVG